MLDWNRLKPRFRVALHSKEKVHQYELGVALRLFGHLQDADAWEAIVRHSENKDVYIRKAAVDAIVKFGGQKAADALANHSDYFHIAAWGLIRLGDVAVPSVVKVIEAGSVNGDYRYEQMFRSYLTHWDELSSPIDPRVVEAVRKSLEDPTSRVRRKEYHREFLERVAKSKNAPWGEEADGIKARLRTNQKNWASNRAVELRADIGNFGQDNVYLIRSAEAHEIEVDGRRYRVTTGGGKSSMLSRGTAFANLRIRLGKQWESSKDGRPLELSNGEHKIRLVFEVTSEREWPLIVTNSVTINVTEPISAQEELRKVEELRKRNAAMELEELRKLQEAIRKQNSDAEG
jgi:hypothetical protein